MGKKHGEGKLVGNGRILYGTWVDGKYSYDKFPTALNWYEFFFLFLLSEDSLKNIN